MNISKSISQRGRILGGLWGSLVGDALGVPVEFKDCATVQANPVTDMRENGTHHQPKDTHQALMRRSALPAFCSARLLATRLGCLRKIHLQIRFAGAGTANGRCVSFSDAASSVTTPNTR